ncbi:MAG: methyltetrahydrofolate cobalamin methyltransferase [Clostridiales Family XIII bacterium]|jgi:5-methyltetrahydrofolate--homocysteine methyltransferase|nr:methyltetrahydrofolate cobalamin methyltransferase [Clostridiales Family XIII bacterium]
MIIIGEKINGAIPSTAKAIQERDEGFIRGLALKQAEFGADYIDVCAGTSPQLERDALKWLIDVVQDAVDTPLCIDSSDCEVILDMMPLAKKPGMLNSVSEEHGKCEILLPKVADSEWKIVALTCDNNGISTDAKVKAEIAFSIVEKAKGYGIAVDRLFIDPLVMSVGTTGTALLNFNETVGSIKGRYPEIHITSGLSNISFGMPFRKAINQQFLTLAMSAGMDSAIMDPTSADMRAAIYATDALLGQDRNCRRYLQAYRKGIIGPPNRQA